MQLGSPRQQVVSVGWPTRWARHTEEGHPAERVALIPSRALPRRGKVVRSVVRSQRLVRVQALSALGQASGAAQLLALILVVGRGRATDTYVVLFAASQAAVTVVVIGTLQPAILSRPNYRRWGRWSMAAAVASGVVVWATAAALLGFGYRPITVISLAAILTASGAASAAAYVESVRRAAGGRPETLAAATVPANMFATLAIFVVPSSRVAAMCFGLLVGNVMTYLYARRDRLGDRVAEIPGSEACIRPGDAAGLAVSSGVGAIGPFGLQAVTASYPPGQATILGFLSRLGSGLVTVGITAFLSVVTDWRRQDLRPLSLTAKVLTWLEGGAFVLVGVGVATGVPSTGLAAVAATAWVAGAGSQACAARALSILGRTSVFGRMAPVAAILYLGGAWWLLDRSKTAFTYFLVLAVVEAGANGCFLGSLRWYRQVLGLIALATCALAIAAIGWAA